MLQMYEIVKKLEVETESEVKRLSTTLTVSYRKQWGLWESIREIFQNSRDETGRNPLLLGNAEKTILSDEGEGLSKEQFMLLGLSEKKSTDAVGQYGEGVKIASLILSRMGFLVKVKSRNWKALVNIEPFESQNIMVYYFSESSEYIKGCSIEIEGLDLGVTSELVKDRFLDKTEQEVIAEGRLGQILTGKYKGKLYNKGIFVSEFGNTIFGYNFYNVETGTDRNFVSASDLSFSIGQMMSYIYDEEIIKDIFPLFIEGKVAEAKSYNLALNDIFVKVFNTLYPNTCVWYDESLKSDVEERGKEYLVIHNSQVFDALLLKDILTANKWIELYDEEMLKERLLTAGELPDKKYIIYHRAMQLIEKAKCFSDVTRESLESNKTICFFQNEGIKKDISINGKILISLTNLNYLSDAIETISAQLIKYFYCENFYSRQYYEIKKDVTKKIYSTLLKEAS